MWEDRLICDQGDRYFFNCIDLLPSKVREAMQLSASASSSKLMMEVSAQVELRSSFVHMCLKVLSVATKF